MHLAHIMGKKVTTVQSVVVKGALRRHDVGDKKRVCQQKQNRKACP